MLPRVPQDRPNLKVVPPVIVRASTVSLMDVPNTTGDIPINDDMILPSSTSVAMYGALPNRSQFTAMSGFSPEETHRRVTSLQHCFSILDQNSDGVLDENELRAIALAFTPDRNVSQDIKTVLAKLDSKQDGVVDIEEWTTALLSMFQFMSSEAFQKHCDDFEKICKNGVNNSNKA